jgi:hypothetical protein
MDEGLSSWIINGFQMTLNKKLEKPDENEGVSQTELPVCMKGVRDRVLEVLGPRASDEINSSLQAIHMLLSANLNGDQTRITEWFERPNSAFGGKTAMQVLQEEGGLERVRKYLNGVTHGWL